VYVLAAGVFCMGTSEFLFVGILPQMAESLHASIPDVGLLISAFAAGMVIGAPIMALATLKADKTRVLFAACTIFALAQIGIAAGSDLGLLAFLRVVSALATAMYWAVAAVTAVQGSPSSRSAEALSLLIGAVALANVAGVPAGTWLGTEFGWRSAFLLLAALTFLSGLVVLATNRRRMPPPAKSYSALVRTELGALNRCPVWLALALTATSQAGIFCAYTYLVPLLMAITELSTSRVPVVLMLFGIGSLLGVAVGGRAANAKPERTLWVGLTGLSLALVLAIAVSKSAEAMQAAVLLFGFCAFSIGGSLNARVFALASDAPTLAAAVNVSAFNVGNMFGPWLGGILISAGNGWVSPLWAGLGLILFTFPVLLVSTLRFPDRAVVRTTS
jgi:DHA1 family chloramphenicol resistance protein-like MFS transporter